MNVRIDYDGMAESGATGTGRTDDLAPTSAAAKQAGRSIAGGEDRVEISPLAGLVTAAASAADPQRAGRVRELTAQYQSGQYHVDAMAVSRAIVAAALPEDPK